VVFNIGKRGVAKRGVNIGARGDRLNLEGKNLVLGFPTNLVESGKDLETGRE